MSSIEWAKKLKSRSCWGKHRGARDEMQRHIHSARSAVRMHVYVHDIPHDLMFGLMMMQVDATDRRVDVEKMCDNIPSAARGPIAWVRPESEEISLSTRSACVTTKGGATANTALTMLPPFILAKSRLALP